MDKIKTADLADTLNETGKQKKNKKTPHPVRKHFAPQEQEHQR